MRGIRLFLYVVLWLFISGFHCEAQQQAWTLPQCIDYALSHNITVKQSQLNTETSKENYQQSKANFFPTLNGNAGHNYYYGRNIDPTTNLYTNNEVRSNNFSLSTGVPLFEGFQLQNSLKQSSLNYMSSKYDLEKIKNDISLSVVTYYLQVLYNRELLKSTQEQVNASGLQRDRTKRMYELGSVSKGNLLDLEAQYASDEVRLVNAQSQLDQALLSLTQLLELDSVKDFTIVEPVVDVPTLAVQQADLNNIYSAALTNQPDIKSYEYKLMSAEKGLSIARGSRYPRLSFGGSVSTNYSSAAQTFTNTSTGIVVEKKPFRNQIDDNLSKSIGFSLSVPIFNGWSAKTNIAHARINLQQSQLTLQSTKKALYKSVQQAVADANAALKKYDANDKSVQSLREAFNYNDQKYNLGLISTYDYMLSKNNLAKAQADLLQAKYDYIFRMKVLDFYQGKPLAF